jgi:16S rRNA (guanine966-N2)-methyltransferase
MRLTGGKARSIVLKLPARGEIRPSTDYLREAVFSSLGAAVVQARVLDVFAGTGAYGLEALSRGATSAVFVEKNPAAAVAIRANIALAAKACGTAETAFGARVANADALRWEPPAGEMFDLLFFDPPWALWEKGAAAAVARLAAKAAADGALLILEAPGDSEPPAPAGWVLRRRLAKGKDQPAAFVMERAGG